MHKQIPEQMQRLGHCRLFFEQVSRAGVVDISHVKPCILCGVYGFGSKDPQDMEGAFDLVLGFQKRVI